MIREKRLPSVTGMSEHCAGVKLVQHSFIGQQAMLANAGFDLGIFKSRRVKTTDELDDMSALWMGFLFFAFPRHLPSFDDDCSKENSLNSPGLLCKPTPSETGYLQPSSMFEFGVIDSCTTYCICGVRHDCWCKLTVHLLPDHSRPYITP